MIRNHLWRPRYITGNGGVPGEAPRESRLHGQLRLNVTRPAMAAPRHRRMQRGTTKTGQTAGGASTPPAETHNLANPMIGCRVQQTCSAQRGASRRSREKRQGRNECEPWQVHAEGQPSSAEREPDCLRTVRRVDHVVVWEWTRSVYVDGGEIFVNPKRGAPARRESGTE